MGGSDGKGVRDEEREADMDSAGHHCFDRAELIYGISIQQAGAEVGWDAYAGFCRNLSVCTGANIFGCHNPRGGKDLRHLRPIQQAHGVRYL